jgi:hypothetical protein
MSELIEVLRLAFVAADNARDLAWSEFQLRAVEEGPCHVGDVVTVSPYGRSVTVRVTKSSLKKTYSSSRFYVQYVGFPLKKDGDTALVGEKVFIDSDHIEIVSRATLETK